MKSATAPFYFRPYLPLLFFTALLLSTCTRRAYSVTDDPYTDPLAAYHFSCTPIDSIVVDTHLEELEAALGKHVDCPDVYRDKLLAALTFYPHLRGIKIKVVRKPLQTSMAVRPANFSLGRNGRGYRIYVDDTNDNKATDFRRASYSAQVGCFIHELGHVTHYESRSNIRLFSDGVNYVSRQRFRTGYEAIADQNAVLNGGGFYTYQYATFIFEKAGISPEYRAFKEANYYTNEEILELHKKVRAEQGLTDGCLLK